MERFTSNIICEDNIANNYSNFKCVTFKVADIIMIYLITETVIVSTIGYTNSIKET